MEIVPIFDAHLYSFKYPEEEFDELERLFDEWNDFELLRKFFEENSKDLKYYQLEVDDAIIETRKEAAGLRKKLIDLSSQKIPDLDSIFVNLDDNESRTIELAKQKSKRRWLRLYALRIDANTYVITGGAIKLTHKMGERLHTAKELDKMELCRNYLKDQGVFDIDSFNELDI
ncbi:MAG: hypothetical protein M1445_19070 [Bacteroidetes bacterium]|nr:hypothetical protein [Bacteroidota bacterium]MCL6102487.1 hypothetical protein [Bacteroidota bacterium]